MIVMSLYWAVSRLLLLRAGKEGGVLRCHCVSSEYEEVGGLPLLLRRSGSRNQFCGDPVVVRTLPGQK
jgi:hypothetical protein